MEFSNTDEFITKYLCWSDYYQQIIQAFTAWTKNTWLLKINLILELFFYVELYFFCRQIFMVPIHSIYPWRIPQRLMAYSWRTVMQWVGNSGILSNFLCQNEFNFEKFRASFKLFCHWVQFISIVLVLNRFFKLSRYSHQDYAIVDFFYSFKIGLKESE